MKNIQKILFFFLIFSLIIPRWSWTQETDQPEHLSTIERNQKSYSTALILGWDPVPGDGLFYTGHPAQGALAAITGILGAITLVAGIASNCNTSGNPRDGACRLFSTGATIVGGLAYGTAYLWDGIGSTIAGKKFRKSNED